MPHPQTATRFVGGAQVPSPGFGAMGLSHAYGKADDEQSKEVLRHAIKIGCTFWDTADVYGSGHNEELIGSVLKEGDNRSKVFIATKFGHEIDPKTKGPPSVNLRGDREYIKQSIENSIQRLGCTPDLYYQHRVDPKVPVEETYSTLEELRKAGKFKYIGISEPSEETLRKAAKVAKIDALQIEYSPWTPDIEKNGMLAAARELGITIIAYSPLGRGFLTGRYKNISDLGPDDGRHRHPRFQEENFANNYKIVEKLEAIAKKKGVSPAQLALAWVAAQGDDIIPIPGTKSIERLDENWATRNIALTDTELSEIRAVVDAAQIAGTRYPEAHMKNLAN